MLHLLSGAASGTQCALIRDWPLITGRGGGGYKTGEGGGGGKCGFTPGFTPTKKKKGGGGGVGKRFSHAEGDVFWYIFMR